MYSINSVSENVRVIEMPPNDAMRFRFYKENKQRILFTRVGAKLQAFVMGNVLVYKKPHANHFHFELMQANRGSLSRGEGGADSEQILENMLEYVEMI